MHDEIFPSALNRRLKKHLQKKAEMQEEGKEIVNIFLKTSNPADLEKILDAIEKKGHAPHKRLVEEFRKRYSKGVLEPDDLKNFKSLYDMNYEAIKMQGA